MQLVGEFATGMANNVIGRRDSRDFLIQSLSNGGVLMGPVKTNQAGEPVTPDNIRSMSAHIGLCVFYAAVAALLFALLGGRSAGADVIGTVVFMVMLGVGHGVIAYGAASAAPWARVASQVVGCLLLFGFPIGTAIGVYLLVNLKWPTTEHAVIRSANADVSGV